MTTTELLFLLGTVWIAPHTNKGTSISIGICYFISAVVVGVLK